MKLMGKTSIITLLLVLGACAQPAAKTPDSSNTTRVGAGTFTPIDTSTGTTNLRQCTDELTNWTLSSLSAFFQTRVTRVEGPVTYCLTASNNAASFRIEFEDTKGVWIYDTADDATKAQIVTSKITSTSIDVVILDPYGLIGIKGTGTSANPISAELRFADLPTYAEALQAKMDEMKAKCTSPNVNTSTGWTTAQCMGYSPPNQFWWESTTVNSTQQIIDEAHTRLSDTTNSTKLGNVSFN